MNKYEKVIVLGSGDLPLSCALTSLEYVKDVEVVEIKISTGSFLERKCITGGIKYRALTKQEITDYLMSVSVNTLVVSASSTYLVPAKVIANPFMTIINWHNALLPLHKGRNAEAWAIYEGDTKTGITWHLITKDVDAGDIILSSPIEITSDMTALSLFKKQISLGAETFKDIASDIFSGSLKTVPQAVDLMSKLHYSKDIPNEGFLDLSWDFDSTGRFLRAMDYGSLLLMGPMKVKIGDDIFFFRKYIFTKSEGLLEGFDGDDYVLIKGDDAVILKRLKKDAQI